MKMKKAFAALAVLVFFCGAAQASPFLVCDSYPAAGPQPEDFVIILNGATYYSAAATDANGLRYLLFDLDGLWAVGPNECTVWARNFWGESIQVPFAFSADPPLAPSPRIVGSAPIP